MHTKKIIASSCLCFLLISCATPTNSMHNTQKDVKNKSNPMIKTIDTAINAGGVWFARNTSDKYLIYNFDPVAKIHPDSHNYLRKMAAMWSIAELYRYTGTQHYKQLAEDGLDFFQQYVVEDEDGFAYMDIDDKRKLGYSAFMILSHTLLEHPLRDTQMRQFADGILAQQQENGAYKTYFYTERDTGQDFYPGEANLALMYLYESTGEKKYLDAVDASFPYYRNYWRDNQSLAFIPWQTQAFSRLYRATGNPEVRDFVFEMNDYLLTFQVTGANTQHPLHIGGFRNPPSISTTSYMEGLIDAYVLARDLHDTSRAMTYGTAMKNATLFTLRLQYTDMNKHELNELDNLSEGGFRQSIENPLVRVDNTQHAVVALIKVQKAELFGK